MNLDICSKCSIYNDGLFTIGVRKTHKVSPRFIDNPERKQVLILAECPGENEDLQNKVLVGRSGKLIDALLEESGLNKFNVRISNVVKCRIIRLIDGKYKNGNPTDEEIKCCSAYLQEEWDFKPDLIVLLGNSAIKAILPDKSPSLIRGKGQEICLGDKNTMVLPTLHPAACLYNPSNRPTLLKHLVNAVTYLKSLS